MDQVSENITSINTSALELGMKFSISARKVSKETVEVKKHILSCFPHGIDHENLMDSVIVSVRFLAKNRSKLTGQQKKKTISDALLLVLDETDSGILENLETVVKLMVPTIVDNLIDVEKGKIKLNKGIKKCFLCCGCC